MIAMNLKNRFRIAIFSMIALLVSIAVILAIGIWHTNVRIQESIGLDNLIVDLYELRILNKEYQVTSSERVEQQWRTIYGRIKSKLGEQPNIPNDVKDALNGLQQIFARLTSMPAASPGMETSQKRFRNQLTATLNLESQRIIDWASDISRHTKDGVVPHLKLVGAVTFAFMLFAALVVIMIMISIARRILSSIYDLMEGAEKIAGGSLGFQVEHAGKDEISLLATAINHMSSKLMASYKILHDQTVQLETEMAERQMISEALKIETFKLEEEIEERKATQQSMKEQTAALEREIAERTSIQQEKTRIEERLQHGDKMKAIGTLAGGVAHDFNNILATIIGYTELAMDGNKKDIQKQYLQETLKGAERAKDLVRQILTFSRQDGHEKKPMDIKLLSKEAVKFLRASIPSSIEIRQHVTAEPCNILADPTQMHQIIMNLCTNASHAMKQTGGIMTIEISRIELAKDEILRHHDLKPGPYVKLTVSDTGHGIDPALHHRIFDPFFTTKTKDEGTGLGLSVVFGIVKSHEGVINVYSEPGKGARFDVYLPRIIHEEVVNGSRNESVIGGKERILFVDDEPALVDMGARMLSSIGYEVTGVISSVDALDMFRVEPERFDLVITDMTLPKMTGIDLSREILKLRPEIPIILCSGIREADTEEQVKSLGIRAYLTKPLTRREISQVIRDTLDGHEKLLSQ